MGSPTHEYGSGTSETYMTSTQPQLLVLQKPLEDPLAYLPCSATIQYKKGQLIYDHHDHGSRVYLIMQGRVNVSLLADSGGQVVVDIYQEDEFFGEAAFLQQGHAGEQATAMVDTKLMSWTTAELHAVIMSRPRLAIALVQVFAKRTMDCSVRIESFFGNTIEGRLARALIRFSERMGADTQAGDGSFRMPPITHELLADYVGTAREIITHYMNKFRREGYLRYSRSEMIVFREPLREWIRASLTPQCAPGTLKKRATG